MGKTVDVKHWNDYPPEKVAFFQCTPDWYRQRASFIGPSTRETIELFSKSMPFIICVSARES
ncbi:hypothetical protein M1N89_01640 [Dehalococcoidia bacterium]|nr:hypothetical protein [Dehalococcoidia bacterium]